MLFRSGVSVLFFFRLTQKFKHALRSRRHTLQHVADLGQLLDGLGEVAHILDAVSYTHLDVYKRQASSEATAAPAAGDFDVDQDITVISREDGSGTRGAFIELTGVEDVYKRQHYHLVEAATPDRLDLIGQALQDADFLAPLQPWEKEK